MAALLIGASLYGYNFLQFGQPPVLDYEDRDWITKARVLGGILLVVQGLETSRFLGEKYSAEIRVRTMRRAQIISGELYVMSVAALMPLVQHLNLKHIQIAEIVSATGLAASALPRVSHIAVSICAILVVWTADLLEIISFASRAFALYYSLQCVREVIVSQHHYRRKKRRLHRLHQTYFTTVAAILAFIVIFAIPAE